MDFRRLSSSSGRGFRYLAYINAWNVATSGGIIAQQIPTSTQRSMKGVVMGNILRQRIVFLKINMDEFVEHAIISQFLSMDAQNPNKNICLFIIFPSGTIKLVSLLHFLPMIYI